MDPLASIRWWWRDWRASDARSMLKPGAERDAYRELLDMHYASEDCTIPDDDARLAAWIGVPMKVWMKMRNQVLQWIPPVSPGKRQHPRCLAEWLKAASFRGQQRDRAIKRWQKPECHGIATALPRQSRGMPTQCHPSPSPSSETEKSGTAGAPPAPQSRVADLKPPPYMDPGYAERMREQRRRGTA